MTSTCSPSNQSFFETLAQVYRIYKHPAMIFTLTLTVPYQLFCNIRYGFDPVASTMVTFFLFFAALPVLGAIVGWSMLRRP